MTRRNQSGDQLLWLAGGVVALMGLAWLIVDAPWSEPEARALGEAATPVAAMRERPQAEQSAASAEAPSATDPLHLARMALAAGMLVEPEDLSAWTLFGRIVDEDPANDSARAGLAEVAAALLQRGHAALEQGRYANAREIAATITARLPGHGGALELAAAIEEATAEPEPPPVPETREPIAPADPIPEMHAAFRDALVRNAVLTPAGSSAVDVVTEMLAVAPEHELTVAARDLLVTELLDRSTQSIEALDAEAAQTWIDAAAALAASRESIERAQQRLTGHLIETESQKILPASELTPLSVTAPEYPRIPLERGIEGWVEIQFVVTAAGTTEDITVIDASHDRYFRDAAVAAVSEWRFEPFVYMDQPIPKSSVTRLAFVLD